MNYVLRLLRLSQDIPLLTAGNLLSLLNAFLYVSRITSNTYKAADSNFNLNILYVVDDFN